MKSENRQNRAIFMFEILYSYLFEKKTHNIIHCFTWGCCFINVPLSLSINQSIHPVQAHIHTLCCHLAVLTDFQLWRCDYFCRPGAPRGS
jgi:hypothetical protein